MNDTTQQDSNQQHSAGGSGLRWVLGAPLVIFLRPRYTAARILRMRRWQLLLLALWALLLAFEFSLLAAAAGSTAWRLTLRDLAHHVHRSFSDQFVHVHADLFEDLLRAPLWEIIGVIVGGVIVVVVTYLLLTCLGVSWAARDEPLGQTFRRSFRIATAVPLILVLPILVYYIAYLGFAQADRDTILHALQLTQDQCGPRPPTTRWRPGTSRPAVPASQAARLDKWYRCQAGVTNQYPTRWERHGRGVAVLAALLSALWSLSVWLRALRAPPVARRSQTPTGRCAECGYDLRFLPMDGRCPECGSPIAESLGPMARIPPDWETAKAFGLVAAWFRTTWSIYRQRRRFFRRLPGWSAVVRSQQYAFLTLGLASLTFTAGFGCIWLLYGRPDPSSGDGIAWACGVAGIVAIGIGGALVAGSGAAFYLAARCGENLAVPLCRVACYLTAWLIPGAVLWWPAMWLLARYAAVLPGILVLTVVGIGWMISQFVAGARMIRYANR